MTNYDALVMSVLVRRRWRVLRRGGRPGGVGAAPDAPGVGGSRRRSRFAAAVSLLLAAAQLRDHVADRDGLAAATGCARPRGVWPCAGPDRAPRPAASWVSARPCWPGRSAGEPQLEAAAGRGSAVLAVTEPTETATAAVFAHTAVLTGRPGNQAALAEHRPLRPHRAPGRRVQDLPADRASGTWNPLAATGTSLGEAGLFRDAAGGHPAGPGRAEFADRRLACLLLEDELSRRPQHVGHGTRALQPRAGRGGPARGWRLVRRRLPTARMTRRSWIRSPSASPETRRKAIVRPRACRRPAA